MILLDMTYKPPFKLTPEIIRLVQAVSKEIGAISAIQSDIPSISLRKKNNIKTIHASLAIEGNTLSLNQVTDIFEGKRVLGLQKDIIEVKNAIEVYEKLEEINPLQEKEFLKSHSILMKGLLEKAGTWRKGGVAIFKEDEITHLPPPASRVSELMSNLFDFISNDDTTPFLIKACVFHYELEFIHPFEDGNGRMGRLWQQLLLMKDDKVFSYLPIEELVREDQRGYYEALAKCDEAGESTLFIEYSLNQINSALQLFAKDNVKIKSDSVSRIQYALSIFKELEFSRKEYRALHSRISDATASRDLKKGFEEGLIIKYGDKNQTKYKAS